MQLGLGTVTFGMNYGIANQGDVSHEQAMAILDLALTQGVKLIDTAQLYGTSEQVLGQYPNITDFKIVSKLPEIEQLNADKVRSLTEQSLNRLNINQLYGMLLHRSDDLLSTNWQKNFAKLEQIKSLGLVQKIGISVYSPEQLSQIVDRCEIDIVQLPLNVFDQRFLTSGALAELKRHGIEIHVRSAFLQGLLLMDIDRLPKYFSPHNTHIKKYFTEIDNNHLSKTQAALNFIKQQAIDYAIVGCFHQQQLKELIADNQLAAINMNYAPYASTNEQLILPTNWS